MQCLGWNGGNGGTEGVNIRWLWAGYEKCYEWFHMVSPRFFAFSPPSFDDNLMLRSGRFGRNVAHVPTFPLRCCLCHSGWLESVESETSFPNMDFQQGFCWVMLGLWLSHCHLHSFRMEQ